jgi:predicted  nucleic acid-binding Zn-ribbon protein
MMDLHQHMGSSEVSRIKQLETDMAEIKSHNQTFQTWFHETGNRLAAQDELLAHLHTSLQQQQHDLVAARTEVHTSADNLHQAMQHTFSSMKGETSHEMSTALST